MLNLNKLTDDERDQFMGLVHESLSINTHFELLRWLRGSLQQHLPHDILIAAWGDFPSGPIYHDVISELPGIRTRKITDDELTCFLTRLFTYWESNGCAPSQLGSKELTNLKGDIECEVLAQNVGKMKSVLVHAIKDFRGRNYCLYVLLSKAKNNPRRSCIMFQALLPHIDASLRKVPHLPEQAPNAVLIGDLKKDDLACLPGITPREAEIMRLVRIGKTNIEIGMILDISAFTVKNHLKHIFQKLNVNNRAQAVSKF